MRDPSQSQASATACAPGSEARTGASTIQIATAAMIDVIILDSFASFRCSQAAAILIRDQHRPPVPRT
ncbi:hypothetical protein ACFPYM_04795 [Methylobacterium hispanicum]|uniref:hypothetical protein n=1 Tax=Methylobacterium hispanicum TaxID=270350 RepID=UPI001EDF3887|nr:hypothetical protein [Methylobacterium hispanicum]